MSEALHDGGCLCGAIRYRARGAPLSVNVCYCTQCQRQTGSPLPSFVSYPEARVELLAGQPATYRSSSVAVRQFCSTCGSSLFWRRDGAQELDIFLGTMDRPADLPAPEYQIWTIHRAPWLPALKGVAEYAEGRPADQG